MTAQAESGLQTSARRSFGVGSVDWSHLWIGALLSDKRVRFVLTGGLNTAFAFACFVAYQYSVGARFGYMWTLLLAHVTTVLFAFATHRRLVFQVSGRLLADLWRFESVYLVALGINAALLPIAVEVISLPVLAAQAGITALNAFVSWMGHSRFTFRRTQAQQ